MWNTRYGTEEDRNIRYKRSKMQEGWKLYHYNYKSGPKSFYKSEQWGIFISAGLLRTNLFVCLFMFILLLRLNNIELHRSSKTMNRKGVRKRPWPKLTSKVTEQMRKNRPHISRDFQQPVVPTVHSRWRLLESPSFLINVTKRKISCSSILKNSLCADSYNVTSLFSPEEL